MEEWAKTRVRLGAHEEVEGRGRRGSGDCWGDEDRIGGSEFVAGAFSWGPCGGGAGVLCGGKYSVKGRGRCLMWRLEAWFGGEGEGI